MTLSNIIKFNVRILLVKIQLYLYKNNELTIIDCSIPLKTPRHNVYENYKNTHVSYPAIQKYFINVLSKCH